MVKPSKFGSYGTPIVWVGLLLLFAFYVVRDQQKNDDNLTSQLKFYNQVLSGYLWDYQDDHAQRFIKTVIDTNNFSLVSLENADGKEIAKEERKIEFGPFDRLLNGLGLIFTREASIDLIRSEDTGPGDAGNEKVDAVEALTQTVVGKVRVSATDTNIYSYLFLATFLTILVRVFHLALENNRLIKRVEQFTEGLLKESEVLLSEAERMEANTKRINQNSVLQVKGIATTSSGIADLETIARKTGQNAQSSRQISHESVKESTVGSDAIDQMESAMADISEATLKIDDFVELLTHIKKKTEVIGELALETRIISFNAAIESAHAGSHGRGFSLVSEEVGRLASFNSKFSQEIDDILTQSIHRTGEIATITKERVNNGHKVLARCKEAFRAIGDGAHEVDTNIVAISSGSEDQIKMISSISHTVRGIEKMAKDNAAEVEDAYASSMKLASIGNTLKSVATTIRDTVSHKKTLLAYLNMSKSSNVKSRKDNAA